MFPILPEDVIDAARTAFSDANDRVSQLLMRQPAMHEEGLDFHLVSKLDEFGTQVVGSGVALAIETHWLGGRRHWGRWEISDIGVIIAVRVQGGLVARKVALLQTKRLYSREIPVESLDRSDFEIGIGRLVDRTDKLVPLYNRRQFSFTEQCVYGALASGSEQVRHIDEYVEKRDIPVYYGFYNPPHVPCTGIHPNIGSADKLQVNEVGCRVLTRDEVHKALETLPVGSPPSFASLKQTGRPPSDDPFLPCGWRLESFVADEVMRCREGRLFEDAQDDVLAALLYRRSAPITAAVVITVDLPNPDFDRR